MHPGMLSFNTLKDAQITEQKTCAPIGAIILSSPFMLLIITSEKMIARFPVFVDRRMDHKTYNGDLPSKYTKLVAKN